jgi:hypothetical protein
MNGPLDNYQFATRFLHAYFEKHAIKDKRQKQGVIKMPKNITCKTIHEAYTAYGTEQHEPSMYFIFCFFSLSIDQEMVFF